MPRIDWQSGWSSEFGGHGSDYFNTLWDKTGQRPYLDASYWVWWEQWFEKEVNGKFVRAVMKAPWGDREFHPICAIEFEREEDAILFKLRCP